MRQYTDKLLEAMDIVDMLLPGQTMVLTAGANDDQITIERLAGRDTEVYKLHGLDRDFGFIELSDHLCAWLDERTGHGS